MGYYDGSRLDCSSPPLNLIFWTPVDDFAQTDFPHLLISFNKTVTEDYNRVSYLNFNVVVVSRVIDPVLPQFGKGSLNMPCFQL